MLCTDYRKSILLLWTDYQHFCPGSVSQVHAECQQNEIEIGQISQLGAQAAVCVCVRARECVARVCVCVCVCVCVLAGLFLSGAQYSLSWWLCVCHGSLSLIVSKVGVPKHVFACVFINLFISLFI